MDEGTPVTEEYKEHDNKFTGKIASITIELRDLKTAGGDGEKAVHTTPKGKALSK